MGNTQSFRGHASSRSLSSLDPSISTDAHSNLSISGPRPTSRVFDAIIVGSGCAGLTAAAVLAQHGQSVLVVEKSKYFGGTTAFSSGGIWIPNNQYQPTIGVKDSLENAKLYLERVVGGLYEPRRMEAFLRSGPEMVKWMERNTAVKFRAIPLPDYHCTEQGASIGRTIGVESFDGRALGPLLKDIRYPLQGYSAFGTMQVDPFDLNKLKDPFGSVQNLAFCATSIGRYATDLVRYQKGSFLANGNALIGRLLYTLQSQPKVVLLNNTAAVRVFKERDTVAGLVIAGADGLEYSVKASKCVILASGGFGRSEDARKYIPHKWNAQPKGIVGDGKNIAMEVGGVMADANPDNAIYAPMSLLQPANGKGPVRLFPHFSLDRSKPGSIIVDSNGRRFQNEAAPYQEFVKTMHARKIDKAYLIGDDRFLKRYGMGMALPWPYPNWSVLRRGYLIKASTVAGLAEKIGVPVDNLQQTVDTCNKNAEVGHDPESHRGETAYDEFYGDPSSKPNHSLGRCAVGPFYALPIYPGNVSTMVGLRVDENARVLSQDDKPIRGLFAVGCDQNNVMRGTYPGGGSSIGPSMTFAFRAGLFIATYNAETTSSSTE